MRIVIVLLLFCLISCNHNSDEVDDAITSLEYINSELDKIGERNISGYKWKIYIPGGKEYPTDSIKISVKELYELQLDIYNVIKDLDGISEQMRKEYEPD